MQEYSEVVLDNNKTYSIVPDTKELFDKKLFDKTVSNALKMLSTNHPVTVISPKIKLSKQDLEYFRSFFCKEAKLRNMNFIYFEIPVLVSESNPLADTMFE